MCVGNGRHRDERGSVEEATTVANKEMLALNLNKLHSSQYQLTKQNETLWLCSSRCCYGSHLFFPLLECKDTLYKSSQKTLIFVHQFF